MFVLYLPIGICGSAALFGSCVFVYLLSIDWLYLLSSILSGSDVFCVTMAMWFGWMSFFCSLLTSENRSPVKHVRQKMSLVWSRCVLFERSRLYIVVSSSQVRCMISLWSWFAPLSFGLNVRCAFPLYRFLLLAHLRQYLRCMIFFIIVVFFSCFVIRYRVNCCSVSSVISLIDRLGLNCVRSFFRVLNLLLVVVVHRLSFPTVEVNWSSIWLIVGLLFCFWDELYRSPICWLNCVLNWFFVGMVWVFSWRAKMFSAVLVKCCISLFIALAGIFLEL